MHPWHYTVEYNGRFKTILTCDGPIGAFRQVTGQKPKDWEQIGEDRWIVNGHQVTKVILPLSM